MNDSKTKILRNNVCFFFSLGKEIMMTILQATSRESMNEEQNKWRIKIKRKEKKKDRGRSCTSAYWQFLFRGFFLPCFVDEEE